MKELKGFYIHAATFVLVNIGLFLINLLMGGSWWFFWPLIGWGIGLGAHAVNVFGIGSTLGQDWEERKTRDFRSPYTHSSALSEAGGPNR